MVLFESWLREHSVYLTTGEKITNVCQQVTSNKEIEDAGEEFEY